MRRLVIVCFVAALAALAPAGSGALAQPRAPEDGRLMPPEKVANHVWVMRQPDRLWAAVIGNVEIIEQSDGVVLVDSGGSIPDGRDVVEAVARLTNKPIKAVAITHWHNDHPLGIPAILDRFPNARIIATSATADFLKTELKTGIGKPDAALDQARLGRSNDTIKTFEEEAQKAGNSPALREQYAIEARWIAQRIKRQMGNYVVMPTQTFRERLLLPDKAAPVELRFLGVGNTHGDLIAWLPKQSVVATGDIIVLPTPYGFTNPIAPWQAVLARLEKLPFKTLIPGHGQVQRDRNYLRTLEWSMTDIRTKARAAAAAGIPKDKAWERFDQAPHRIRFHATDDWAKLWLAGYWLEGMFETAYDEAKGIPASVK